MSPVSLRSVALEVALVGLIGSPEKKWKGSSPADERKYAMNPMTPLPGLTHFLEICQRHQLLLEQEPSITPVPQAGEPIARRTTLRPDARGRSFPHRALPSQGRTLFASSHRRPLHPACHSRRFGCRTFPRHLCPLSRSPRRVPRLRGRRLRGPHLSLGCPRAPRRGPVPGRDAPRQCWTQPDPRRPLLRTSG
jgi:hypothetical protein